MTETELVTAELVSTRPVDGDVGVYDERNLVVANVLPVTGHQQLRNDLVEELS